MGLLIGRAKEGGEKIFEVPSSKSILNRALILAAFSEGDALLRVSDYGEDASVMLSALASLGISIEKRREGLLVRGTRSVCKAASVDVGSAGTAARFLPAVLAVKGGDYVFSASPQMARRPMDLGSLQSAGAEIFRADGASFPFRMVSKGRAPDRLEVSAGVSTQFASGLLLAAAVGDRPRTVVLRDLGRTSYLDMTRALINSFGGKVERRFDGGTEEDTVIPIIRNPKEYAVEPDLSSACYLYALAPLLKMRVTVKETSLSSVQGDLGFLKRLAASSELSLEETTEGLALDGRNCRGIGGLGGNYENESDQALTVAALAPFADSVTEICGIGHIRRQECDRIYAICKNLKTLGVSAEEREDGVVIRPSPVKDGEIETFGDHRVAMAFALTGLKTGTLTIDDPLCCKKTFPRYFEILSEL